MSQDIIRPVSNPIKETGHIQILRGDLAPEGSVAKITGKEGLYFSGNFDALMPLNLAFQENQNLLSKKKLNYDDCYIRRSNALVF